MLITFIYIYKFTVVVKRLDPNITPESRVKEMITNYKSS